MRRPSNWCANPLHGVESGENTFTFASSRSSIRIHYMELKDQSFNLFNHHVYRIHYMELKARGLPWGRGCWCEDRNPLHGVESLTSISPRHPAPPLGNPLHGVERRRARRPASPQHSESITWSWKMGLLGLDMLCWISAWIHYMELKVS